MITLMFVGQNPSCPEEVTQPFSKARCKDRLLQWIDEMNPARLPVEYINVIPNIPGPVKVNVAKCDLKHIQAKYDQKKYLFISLGVVAHQALDRLKIHHYVMPHPSGLNRKINSNIYMRNVLMQGYRWICQNFAELSQKYEYSEDELNEMVSTHPLKAHVAIIHKNFSINCINQIIESYEPYSRLMELILDRKDLTPDTLLRIYYLNEYYLQERAILHPNADARILEKALLLNEEYLLRRTIQHPNMTKELLLRFLNHPNSKVAEVAQEKLREFTAVGKEIWAIDKE